LALQNSSKAGKVSERIPGSFAKVQNINRQWSTANEFSTYGTLENIERRKLACDKFGDPISGTSTYG
jgi:hypothetical protein